MPPVILSAHFDGKQILLDAPYPLDPETKLLVTILPKEEAEEADWLRLSLQNFAAAYGEDEPEYTLDLLKEVNPDMKEGDVVLTPIPQADGAVKTRPAIFLREMQPYGDLLL